MQLSNITYDYYMYIIFLLYPTEKSGHWEDVLDVASEVRSGAEAARILKLEQKMEVKRWRKWSGCSILNQSLP